MNTLRIDSPVAPPPLEVPAARPAPAPRSRTNDAPAAGPDSARASASTEDGADVDEAALRAAADEVGSELSTLTGHSLEITFEEEDSRYVVTILDNDSGEVLRQIPPESLLEANRQLSSLRGLLFDDHR